MKQKYFWKVTDKNRNSFWVFWWNKALNIKYNRLNKWIYPKIKGSKIIVCPSLYTAKNLAVYNSRIYKCEVRNPIRIQSLHFGTYTISAIKKFWKSGYYTKAIPAGRVSNTYGCDAVKLIKEIK